MSRHNTQEVTGGKRTIQSISGAMRNDDNGVRISNEGSSSPRTEEVPESSSSKKGKKKARGPSRLNVIAVGEKDRLTLEFNELGQPIGKASIHLSTVVGILAQEYVPITYKSWDKVDIDIKDRLWEFITQRFKVDEYRKNLILGMISSKWRDFKSTLSGKILAIATGPYMTRHHLLLKPAEVKPNEWEEFVNGRLSHEFKLISDKHKAARAKQIHPHTTSRKGYARLTEEMKMEKQLKVVRRVDVWLKGHTRKNGNPVNEAVQETMTKIKEIPPTQDLISIRDDALAKVLGPERPGRVRGLGFGVTPTKVDAIVQSNGRVAALENQLKEFMEWRIQMEALLSQGNRANMDQFGGREDMAYNSAPTPQSNQDSTFVPSTRNLANASCKLLHWVGTGEVVANAKIESTDQQSLVHHQILGPDCYKVWVLETLVPNVMVYRYSDVFSTLDDAKGSTIAWPHRYIKFD